MAHSSKASPYNRRTQRPWLRLAARHAERFLDSLAERPVAPRASFHELREALGGGLPETGLAPEAVVEKLAGGAEPGLVASAGPRYFGFVIGGSLPAAVAADWLTSAWDQNGGLNATSPAVAAVEDVVAGWVKELLGLPSGASVFEVPSRKQLSSGRYDAIGAGISSASSRWTSSSTTTTLWARAMRAISRRRASPSTTVVGL